MSGGDLLAANLSSPIVLAFALGVIARLVRSDLRFPEAVKDYLSLFLLLAIGLKGGSSLAGADAASVLLPAVVTLLAGVVTCVSAFVVASRLLRLSRVDAAAMAAHYGSASAVTFIAASQFVALSGTYRADDWMVALLVLLEIPAIVLALWLARDAARAPGETLREILTGRASILLLGGLAIGLIAGPRGLAPVDAMYVELFQGMLMLYLLDLGMSAGEGLLRLRGEAARLVLFGTVLPCVHGVAGTLVGTAIGLVPGSAAVFGALVASASYIAAPAAMRLSLPAADVGRCVTASLGITFPFNVALGIPLYFLVATSVAR